MLFLYLIERTQHWLFLSVGMGNVTPVTAWNTAASFTTNTNWQNYSGESTMSYLTQMSGLAVQNFMSAAVGLVVAIAMIRGFGPGRRRRGHEHRHLGRQGGREHGGPGLQPDQAHRDRGDRQAVADHPRRADHLLHHQRRSQVLRHHPGHVLGRDPRPGQLNVLHLATPKSAITSAIIFNALIIVALIPLALRGVRYRPSSASSMLRRNLLIYGVGGLIIPFIGIWAIDLIIQYIPGFGR